MFNITQTMPRRGFLGSVAAGAAALGVANLVSPFRTAAKTFDEHKRSDTSDFDRWLGKIQGKHRQVFDSPAHRDGLALAWVRVFLSTYNDTGTPDGDLSAVHILRHEAIPLAMEDKLWAKYKFGELFKVTDGATKTPALRNPFWNPKPGELMLPDMSVDQLQKRGVLFGVCDMAITVYTMNVAKEMKMDAADVKKEWITGILPGIQLVPSGVLAVNRAQEHGCTYCFAG